ncbi:Tim44-like domain protein [Pseudodesulfovibrio hydrargyri]|uniref:Tim44-like domain protein n=1 Tax=Pseudodesulfovibrio hydrargyri TaxID=2125990 RepID=A0A1J5MZ73_9BACT|nr:Tim44-like domain-containing protein [Pseudodesulfovibrio hydrargyri]OIQ51750.1 Tim44-like domain protein [Pseudodesulfovibrio hydrargyri]
MHNDNNVNASGFAGRLTGRPILWLSAPALVLIMATPALAQAAPPSRSGSVLNILLLVLIAYFLVRMFRRRSGGGNDKTRPGRWSRPDYPTKPGEGDGSGSDADSSSASEDRPAQKPQSMDRHEAARRTWDMLRSEDTAKTSPSTPTGAPPRADGFDEAEFLEGAKVLFSRFQQARDKEDYDALRDFLSDEVYSDAVAAGERPRTEVMLVSALLTELHSADGRTVASVHYDAQLRTGEEGRPVQLRTVWEFGRDDSVPGGLWVLEKINSIDQ